MNRLYLKLVDSEKIVYGYIANGQGEEGEIVYSFSTEEITITKLAGNDEGGILCK